MEKKRTSPTKKSLSGILLMCMLAFALALSGCTPPDPPDGGGEPPPPPGPFSAAEIAEKFGNTVVRITSQGTGSGVIYKIKDGYGYIITNDHVIRASNGAIGVSYVEVKPDRIVKNDRIEIVGADRRTDLAVIKIKAENLQAAEFGDSDAVKTGEKVYAIGNPKGSEHDIEDGIIRTNQLETMVDADGKNLNQYLKTSISINSGNSGGPIFNEYGKIVAIVDLSRNDAESMNYSIPSNKAKEIADELEKKGYVSWPYMGVYAENAKYKNGKPAILVQEVMDGSPAAEAGFKKGDVIIDVDGISVSYVAELRKYINDAKIGKRVKIQVRRGNKEGYIEIKELKELPKSNQQIDWS